MYRAIKALNNNCVLAESLDSRNEVILLGKGIGFGKKVSERFDLQEGTKVYSLQAGSRSGNPIALAKSIDSLYFEITNQILIEAEARLGDIDSGILLPLADHIAFAVKRIKEQGSIQNPLTDEIKLLFEEEYKVALFARKVIYGFTGVKINDDEAGYITIHLHTAIDKNKKVNVMNMAQIVHECIRIVEERRNISISKESLAYNRLLSHMKYMIMRMQKDERIKLDVNKYMVKEMPSTFQLAEELCNKVAEEIKSKVYPEEIGYLAMHIERVCTI